MKKHINKKNKQGWSHGLHIFYYDKKKSISSKANYIDGVLVGPIFHYKLSGELEIITNYSEGKIEGEELLFEYDL